MNFPSCLNERQIDRYEKAFAEPTGELLLAEWEEGWRSPSSINAFGLLSLQQLTHALLDGQIDFALACLKVVPDRFFDLKKALNCRDAEGFQNTIPTKLRSYAGEPRLTARYHDLLELMARRGWDMRYGSWVGGAWPVSPMLHDLAGITGSVPLFRRLLPYVGGEDGLRAFSESYCGGAGADGFGTTLLHRAVEAADVEMVRFLVQEVGIDPNATDPQACTALMGNIWSLDRGSQNASQKRAVHEAVRELLDLGLDLEYPDRDGETALVYAVKEGCVESVKFLLSLGADPDVCDADGMPMIVLAELLDHEDVARVFRSLEMSRTLDNALGAEEMDDLPPAPSRSGGLCL